MSFSFDTYYIYSFSEAYGDFFMRLFLVASYPKYTYFVYFCIYFFVCLLTETFEPTLFRKEHYILDWIFKIYMQIFIFFKFKEKKSSFCGTYSMLVSLLLQSTAYSVVRYIKAKTLRLI